MKKVIDAMFSGYLNDQFEELIPKYAITSAEKEFDALWNSFNDKLPKEERVKNSELKTDSEYEIVKREFQSAFRLGFILCAEVFLGE